MDRFLYISAGVSVFIAVAMLAALAFLASTAEDAPAEDAPATPDAPTPAPAATAQVAYYPRIEEPDDSAREIPDLTENQIEEVKNILRSDPSLKSLMAGESYTIRRMGPWLSGGEESEFIGALVDAAPDSPISYDGFLPSVYSYNTPKDGSGELYVGGGQVSLQAEGIESFDILVDLNKGEVAAIEVYSAASLNVDYRYEIPGMIRYFLTR